jgi:ribosomal RNA assembly protein
VKEVIKAFGRGFDFETSLNLLDEDYFLDILDVKPFTGKSRNRQIILKGRVIGSKGKTKSIIEKYSDAKIVIYGKSVSIVGKAKNVRLAREAIEMLLNGADHSSVYRFLEKERVDI